MNSLLHSKIGSKFYYPYMIVRVGATTFTFKNWIPDGRPHSIPLSHEDAARVGFALILNMYFPKTKMFGRSDTKND